jgi:prepilin-type N-terminal cleavage/methylation domain-containing protein
MRPGFLQNRDRGFTLLEMIVSLAVFSIVAVVAVGAMTRIVGLNRQAQTLHSAMNNIGFTLESMSRELRVGSAFHCDANIPMNSYSIAGAPSSLSFQPCAVSTTMSPGSGQARIITFISSKTAICGAQSYKLLTAYAFMPDSSGTKWSLQKAQQTACNQTLTSTSFSPVLDEGNVNLTDFRLGVFQGTTESDAANYNIAYVRLIGYAGTRAKDQNYFDIETSLSERVADFP